MKNNRRLYGSGPPAVAVVHGGPGAAGELAPLARELGRECGVMEPLQTARSLRGQVAELKTCLERGICPVTLIGHSYGAFLSLITAAKHPTLVKKLILVGSAVFEDEYATQIMSTRRSRISEADNAGLDSLLETLDTADSIAVKDIVFTKMGRLLEKADAFDLLPETDNVTSCRYDIYERIWPEVAALRTSGKLLSYAMVIRCPVVAIHGCYDPHPAEGVWEPLGRTLSNFKFILLENCGHAPWRERQAKESFFRILRSELGLDIEYEVD